MIKKLVNNPNGTKLLERERRRC